VFPYLAIASLIVLAGCNPPPATTDSGVTPDTGSTPVDAYVPPRDAFVAPDTGPVPLCTGTGCDIEAIELMSATSCVLRANGQVDCWGRGQDGELGDGLMHHTDDCRRTAGEGMVDCSRVATTVALPGPASAIFSRGSIQNCAILETSGETWCWGGQFYRLGSTLEHTRFMPEHVAIAGTAIADHAVQLAPSFSNLCWIAQDTTVQCIGAGSGGRLGNGSFSDTTTPVNVLMPDGTTNMTGVLELDQSSGHACARTADHLYCWGNNHYAQLGVDATGHSTCGAAPNTYDCSNIPIEVTGVTASTITDIQLGGDFACVLHSTGHVQCWGGGQTGGLGTGDIHETTAPVEPMGLTAVTELRVVDGNACAVQGGSVLCWGPADVGQIGDGSMAHASTPCINSDGNPYDCQLTPTAVMGMTGVSHIAVGEGHSCALKTNGEVWCWGMSLRYQLGDQMRPDPQFAPVRVTALF
jgi:alpha-tubulin suppressor-like RCC1 family protein